MSATKDNPECETGEGEELPEDLNPAPLREFAQELKDMIYPYVLTPFNYGEESAAILRVNKLMYKTLVDQVVYAFKTTQLTWNDPTRFPTLVHIRTALDNTLNNLPRIRNAADNSVRAPQLNNLIWTDRVVIPTAADQDLIMTLEVTDNVCDVYAEIEGPNPNTSNYVWTDASLRARATSEAVAMHAMVEQIVLRGKVLRRNKLVIRCKTPYCKGHQVESTTEGWPLRSIVGCYGAWFKKLKDKLESAVAMEVLNEMAKEVQKGG